MRSIEFVSKPYKIDFKLHDRVTFVSTDDSGAGKTFLFDKLQLIATESAFSFIKCLNFKTPDIQQAILMYADNQDVLVVIDNGDVVITPEIRNIIRKSSAQFLIFSREYFGLAFSRSSMSVLTIAKKVISLDYPLMRVG